MFDLKKEWSISFAGCGFMAIYYVGASSCILERFPRFIQDASKIYGSSAGALTAAVLAIGIPVEKCCADLMLMARGARRHRMGPLHPAFNLLELVKDSLLRMLPEDAHVRASGKLCVSLTRVSDRKNVLVSEFDSREELMQALICSCFVPFYCGMIPPKYRGVHYVDGAVSDNLPRCHERNTILVSAFAGESDLCPPSNTRTFHQVRFNNMSVQVNAENIYRIKSTFFPPEAEAMAEICHNGYMDALRFLRTNNLISSECPSRGLETVTVKSVCCELAKELAAEEEESCEKAKQGEPNQSREEHWWLDPKLVVNLPVTIKSVLCEACRETNTAGGLLSHMTGYLPKMTRLVDWIPNVPGNMSRLAGMAGDIYRQAWKEDEEDFHSPREEPLRRCTSLPSGLNLWNDEKGEVNALPPTPDPSPTYDRTFTWNTQTERDPMPPTPPSTPTLGRPTPGLGEAPTESPRSSGGGWGLGRAVGWIRNMASEQTSTQKKTDDSTS